MVRPNDQWQCQLYNFPVDRNYTTSCPCPRAPEDTLSNFVKMQTGSTSSGYYNQKWQKLVDYFGRVLRFNDQFFSSVGSTAQSPIFVWPNYTFTVFTTANNAKHLPTTRLPFNQKRTTRKCAYLSMLVWPFCSWNFDLDPVTLIYESDVDILKTYRPTRTPKLNFLGQSFQKPEHEQERQVAYTRRCNRTHYRPHSRVVTMNMLRPTAGASPLDRPHWET